MKNKILLLSSLSVLLISSISGLKINTSDIKVLNAEISGPIEGSLATTSTIDLNDNSDDEIRDYYASLSSLDKEELKGTNLLKNLKPILQNMTYYSYDNVWKIYEISDREWSLSPKEEIEYGTYDSATNTYLNYRYSSSNSNIKNNPYVHTLYRNRDENGITLEEGRIKEWGDHNETGTNREHVWCQSRGFKASSGATGPAGTDIHHLISGDGYVNQSIHNNNPYGYVDTSKTYTDASSKHAYDSGNLLGSPLNTSENDQYNKVFEPQDSDKGDIARALFYMVACYNNLANESGVISEFNPNLELVSYVTSIDTETSSDTYTVKMGNLKDLLLWHQLDPVDEYEIHRNNLIYNNYQHNRNPFIDFPDWVDIVWGDNADDKSANPLTDNIYGSSLTPISVTGITLSSTTLDLKVGESAVINANITPSNATNRGIIWTSNNNELVNIETNNGRLAWTISSSSPIKVTALKEGKVTITAKTVDGDYTAECVINISASGAIVEIPVYAGYIAIAVLVLIILIVVIVISKNKKGKKALKKVSKSINKSSKKKSSSKKKK